MHIKDGFVLREVAGQAMVVATGEAARGFQGMVRLNGTGAEVWRALEAGASRDEAAGRLAEVYGVELARARADVDAFIERMAAEGFLR